MVVLQEIISIWSCSVGGMWGWWWWILLPHSSFSWGSVLWFVTYFYTRFFFTGLQLHFISTFSIDAGSIYIRYYLFVLFSTPEIILVQLCISLAVCRWVVCSCEFSRVRGLCPISSHPIGPAAPLGAPCASTSQGLSRHTKPTMTSVSSNWSCEHLVVHRGAAINLCFCHAVPGKVNPISHRHLAGREEVFLQLNQTGTKQQVLCSTAGKASLAGLGCEPLETRYRTCSLLPAMAKLCCRDRGFLWVLFLE